MNSLFRFFTLVSLCLSVQPLGAVSILHLKSVESDRVTVTPTETVLASELQKKYIQFEDNLKVRDWDAAYRVAKKLLEEDDSHLGFGLRAFLELESEMLSQQTFTPVWESVELTLGDYYVSLQPQNRSEAWGHWKRALDYWSRSTDLDNARSAYIQIVREAVGLTQSLAPAEMAVNVPVSVLQNILEISKDPKDKAFAYYYLAERQLKESVSFSQSSDLKHYFEKALELGEGSDWYDRALYLYGKWLMGFGSSYFDANGDFQAEPDYAKAVDVLQRLTKQVPSEEAFYSKKAQLLLDRILEPRLSVNIKHSYHPDTEMECSVEMANVSSVAVNIYPISLVNDCTFGDEGLSVDLTDVESLRAFSLNKSADREHYTVTEKLSLGQDLPMGAYYVEAEGGGVTAHDILLISDVSVILKHAKNQVLLYFCDSLDGSPIANASATVWFSEGKEPNGKDKWVGLSTETNSDGIAFITFVDESRPSDHRIVWAALSKDDRQAYVYDLKSHQNQCFDDNLLNVNLLSDKQSYSGSNDELSWAAILRYPGNSQYVYPAKGNLSYRIKDEDGVVLGEAKVQPEDIIEELGLIKGRLPGLSSIKSERLYIEFVVEEPAAVSAVLPLLNRRVAEKDPLMAIDFDGDGSESLHVVHSGETLNGRIHLNGSISSLTSQNISLEIYREKVDSLFEGIPESRELVKTQVVALDSIGSASFLYQLERDVDSAYCYIVSVDLPTLQGQKTVSRDFYMIPTSYEVSVSPEKKLLTPDEPIRVNIRARNALGNGQMVQGNLRLLRQTWREVWVDRSGKQIGSQELQKLKESGGGWFSFGPSPSDYRLEEEGYVHDQISQVRLMTDNQGNVEYYYEPLAPGYYVLRWVGRDADGKPIRAESRFWVASEMVTDIGYRPEGIDLVVDDCGASQRKNVPVLTTGPNPDRWTLLVTGNEQIQGWKLIHPESESNVTFLDFSEFTGRNAFVQACGISGDMYYSDLEEVLLYGSSVTNQVEVKSNTYGYEPAQKAQFSVTVKDEEGNPIPNAAVVFQIKKLTGFEALKDNVVCEPLVPRASYKLSDKISLVDSPYFRPLVEDEKQSVYMYDSDDVELRKIHPVNESCVGSFNPMAGEDVVYWDCAHTTDADGKILYDIPLTDQLGEWTATAAVITDSQCIRYGRSEFRTRLPMVASLGFPDSLSPGDIAVAKAHVTNNTFFNIKLKLALDSGDFLRQISFKNEQGEVFDLKETSIRDHYVSVPAKSSVDVQWSVVVERPLSSEQYKANLKLVAAMKNRVTSDTESCSIQVPDLSGKITNAIVSDQVKELSFSVTDMVAQGEVFVQVTSSIEPLLHDTLLRLLNSVSFMPDKNIVALDESVVGDLIAYNGITLLKKRGNDVALSRLLQQSGFSLDDLSALKNSLIQALQTTVNPDGGWSWGQKTESDVGFTAYVLWSLVNLDDAPDPLLVGVRDYLTRELVEKDLDMQMQAWLLRALAAYNQFTDGRPTRIEARALVSLIRRKSELGSQGVAFLALAAQDFGLSDEALELLKSLEGASLSVDTGMYWSSAEKNAFWGSSDVETTAFVLSAFLRIDPGHPSVEHIVQWMAQSRIDFSDWGSLRATCIALKSLGWYYNYAGEWSAQDRVTVSVNDKEWKRINLNPVSAVVEGLPQAVPSDLLQIGENSLKIASESNKSILCALKQSTLSREIQTASLSELSLKTSSFRMHRIPTLLKGFVSSVDSFDEKSSVSLGDRLEIIVKIHVDSPVSYTRWTIPCPSGFSISGFSSANTLRLYRVLQKEGEKTLPVDTLEGYLQDDRFDVEASRILNIQRSAEGVEFLLDSIEPGEWEMHYSLVADAEGTFLLKPVSIEQVHNGLSAISGDARPITVIAP